MESLIEVCFPVDVISRDSAIEMSFKPTPAYLARCKELKLKCKRDFFDPKIRSLHPWLARRSRSVARALTLAAILPADVDKEKFLSLLGFTREALVKAVSRGYPPLISYLGPESPEAKGIVMDPMAGGGSIPLESALLGLDTIACDYNPVAYLILKATVEYPIKFGMELYEKLLFEVKKLIEYAKSSLGGYYSDAEGYIFLRQVRLGLSVKPLQRIVPLTTKLFIEVDKDVLRFKRPCNEARAERRLLNLWLLQHLRIMREKNDDFSIVHRLIAVQTRKGFREPKESDIDYILKAYDDYFENPPIHIPKVDIPKDNEVFRDINVLGKYNMLFNPRQAISIGFLMGYVKGRIKELVEKYEEFGAAVGLYLAFGIDRIIDFNSILSTWNYNTQTIRDATGSYYKFRKLRLEGIYAEASLLQRTLEWVFEPSATNETAGGILPVVRELIEKSERLNPKPNIDVYLCDVLKLSERFRSVADVVNVDPPYYDQHVYSDFSEFFWPFLRVMLEPALHYFFPNEKTLIDWKPNNWKVPRASELIARSNRKFEYERKLIKALIEIKKAMKDNGILILWFSHKSFEVWSTLAKALREAGFKITSVIPLPSEHPTRSITRGGEIGINRVLIVVARKNETFSALKVNTGEVLTRFIKYLEEAKIFPNETIPEEEKRTLVKAVELILRG